MHDMEMSQAGCTPQVSGKTAVVVGAGPVGLLAATALGLRGFEVKVSLL